ncbi:uncharacterized protein LOC133419891 isoform X3 [Cololabis saira]|uniref:uncharacterized protein LOC133419891 isoform X3 n=1 Tax=Cololabis saira TaxID=129043 RepID=UPI002AD44995|nr:uncharacterized protein LOC133419891 isoform X3 [Cololabis saira]
MDQNQPQDQDQDQDQNQDTGGSSSRRTSARLQVRVQEEAGGNSYKQEEDEEIPHGEALFSSVAGHYQEEAPSTSAAQIDTLTVKELYRMHLIKKIAKTDIEMLYLDRQIRKADLEIEILKHKLEVGAWSQVKYVDCWNNIGL